MIVENENQAGQHPTTYERTSEFEGSWERSGRSLNAAAVLALLGIGVLYFNAQTILVFVAIGIDYVFSASGAQSEDFFEWFRQGFRSYANAIRIAVLLSQYLFMLLPSWWLIRRWHTANVKGYVRFKSSTVAEIALAVVTTLAVIPTGTYIANELAHRFNIPEFFTEMLVEIFTATSFPEFLWLAFVIALTPAICEEVFFRGFIQRTLERTIRWKSIVLTGVVFGLFHMQPMGLITLSLLGILFGYFFYRSKSILPAMAAHFTNNLFAIYLLYRPSEIGEVDLTTSEQIPIAWVLVTLPIASGLLVLYHKITARKHS